MKILFFASLAELAGRQEMMVQDVNSVGELKLYLKKNFPAIGPMNFSIAVNKVIVQSDTSLTDSDEIALLPPFSGG